MEQKHLLPNGVRILLEELPHVHSAVIGFWIETGSKNERPDERGVSHFLEHMLFKGTGNRTALEIAQTLEDKGGMLNAFTNKELTCYFARCLDVHLATAIDVLADMLTGSLLASDEIERERRVILEELKSTQDSPEEVCHEQGLRTLWPDHPLGLEIIGTAETIGAMSQDHLRDYMRRYYTADRLIIAVAGHFDSDKVLAQLAGWFGTMPAGSAPALDRPPLPVARAVSTFKDIEQAHLCLMAPSLNVNDPDRYTLALIDTILGGGMSSMLFQEVREKRGLVYGIHSFESLFRLSGVFGVAAATSPDKVQEVTQVVFAELQKITSGTFDDSLIQRAKDQLKGNLLLSLEAVRNRMMRIARNEIFHGRFIPSQEIIDAIDAIDRDKMLQVANKVLVPDRMTISVVGPFQQPLSLSPWAA
jgi:predicted Zn-dependent peptidase